MVVSHGTDSKDPHAFARAPFKGDPTLGAHQFLTRLNYLPKLSMLSQNRRATPKFMAFPLVFVSSNPEKGTIKQRHPLFLGGWDNSNLSGNDIAISRVNSLKVIPGYTICAVWTI